MLNLLYWQNGNQANPALTMKCSDNKKGGDGEASILAKQPNSPLALLAFCRAPVSVSAVPPLIQLSACDLGRQLRMAPTGHPCAQLGNQEEAP